VPNDVLVRSAGLTFDLGSPRDTAGAVREARQDLQASQDEFGQQQRELRELQKSEREARKVPCLLLSCQILDARWV
jgi:hypothetical protein